MKLEELIHEADEFRSKYGDNTKNIHWPKAFKEKVIELKRSGASLSSLSRDLGISHQTLRSWMRAENRRGHFTEVIQNEATNVLTLRWSEGLEVEGLRFEQLCKLLRDNLL